MVMINFIVYVVRVLCVCVYNFVCSLKNRALPNVIDILLVEGVLDAFIECQKCIIHIDWISHACKHSTDLIMAEKDT